MGLRRLRRLLVARHEHPTWAAHWVTPRRAAHVRLPPSSRLTAPSGTGQAALPRLSSTASWTGRSGRTWAAQPPGGILPV